MEWLAWLHSNPDGRSGPAPKSCKIMPTNIYVAKDAPKSIPGLPEVEDLPIAVPEQKLIISGSYSLISGKAPIPR